MNQRTFREANRSSASQQLVSIVMYVCAQIAYSVQRLATCAGEICRTRPDGVRGPPSLLCNGYRLSGLGVTFVHTPPFSAEVKERVEIYFYSPSRPSWPVLGQILPSFSSLCTQRLISSRK